MLLVCAHQNCKNMSNYGCAYIWKPSEILSVILALACFACLGRVYHIFELRGRLVLRCSRHILMGSRASSACLRLSLRSSSAVKIARAISWCLTLSLGDSSNLSAMRVRLPPSPPTKKRPPI